MSVSIEGIVYGVNTTEQGLRCDGLSFRGGWFKKRVGRCTVNSIEPVERLVERFTEKTDVNEQSPNGESNMAEKTPCEKAKESLLAKVKELEEQVKKLTEPKEGVVDFDPKKFADDVAAQIKGVADTLSAKIDALKPKETPPQTEETPAETPPAETPPTETPPAETPPANPPAEKLDLATKKGFLKRVEQLVAEGATKNIAQETARVELFKQLTKKTSN